MLQHPEAVDVVEGALWKWQVKCIPLHNMTVGQAPCPRKRNVDRPREVYREVLLSRHCSHRGVAPSAAAHFETDFVLKEGFCIESCWQPLGEVVRVIISCPSPFVPKGVLGSPKNPSFGVLYAA